MKLSIIIVNYNVAYFLEQCLQSVYIALKTIDAEVFVVDNNSVDNSVEMLQVKFPEVQLIQNRENVGFSKANNQAIRLAKGEYILLLNPDTVVESDTFEKIISFMDATPDAGGLGTKMVNGRGEFLPESKRSLPVPTVAFYKIFGLSALFKKSKRFGKYHLSYLDPDEINSVEILAGAFMLLRKSVLDSIGLLDEDYFMYGEDIDLSYRITKAGYKNYYFPKTRIIHYKGESTKKSSINYVFVFYRAMQIFAKKHFSQKNAILFNIMINTAIYLRAFFSIAKRLFLKILVPLLDYILIYAGVLEIAFYWEHSVLMARESSFSNVYMFLILPVYAFIWTLFIYFAKGYKKPVSISRVNQGVIGGTIFILLVYSLLGEDLRFSRAIILFGAVWTFFCTNILRYIIGKLNIKSYPIGERHNNRILIIGDEQETSRVSLLLSMTTIKSEFIGFINPVVSEPKNPYFIGNITQLKDIITIYQIGEVIFCGKNMTAKEIINYMSNLQDTTLEYKIAPPESSYVIGSNSINTSHDIYMLDINSIGRKENQQRKRIFDVFFSLVCFIFYPILIFFVKRKKMFFHNIISCLTGKKTWVGYTPLTTDSQQDSLPLLRKSVLFSADALNLERYNDDIIEHVNSLYARNYKLLGDIHIILKEFRNLGR
ncbi:MAG: glycosyltransferase family 2 protein [Bacteroidales bacterium]|jgi:GT2 family glycosyltransferase|nr:glycosyltransferase family 2 protein [Bacteroidales bacterium]